MPQEQTGKCGVNEDKETHSSCLVPEINDVGKASENLTYVLFCCSEGFEPELGLSLNPDPRISLSQ